MGPSQIENTAARAVVYALDGAETRIEPRQMVVHTACLPAEVTFQTKAGGPLTKAVTARYEAKDGQVYRLTGTGAEIAIDVGVK